MIYRKMGDERVNGTTQTTQSTTQTTRLPNERKLLDTEASIVDAMKEIIIGDLAETSYLRVFQNLGSVQVPSAAVHMKP